MQKLNEPSYSSSVASPRAGAGAVDLSDILSEIPLSQDGVNVPDLGAFSSASKPSQATDLFAEKKRAHWSNGANGTEARCDFDRKMRLTRRGDVNFISLWKKSLYGRTLVDIKSDPEMVAYFADNMVPLIQECLGYNLAGGDWAVVTTPKRRHLTKNFASLISERIAAALGVPFYEDVALCHSKQRMNAVFTLKVLPREQNLIVFDDFVTTGQTLHSMRVLLEAHAKNIVFFTGINNKL